MNMLLFKINKLSSNKDIFYLRNSINIMIILFHLLTFYNINSSKMFNIQPLLLFLTSISLSFCLNAYAPQWVSNQYFRS